MYNRYVRNDLGVYTRIPEAEPQQERSAPQRPLEDAAQHTSSPPPPGYGENPPRAGHSGSTADSLSGVLRRLLDRLHLEKIDSGDLLLLLLLFLLYREDADEELLFALGLLLIL